MTKQPTSTSQPESRTARNLSTLSAERLIQQARRRTGLDDFGDPPVEPALAALADSLDQEAELHSMGRFMMRMHLRDLLETRLRLTALWNPRLAQLDATPLRQPIFITGMPRSGSTFLHELLTED